jgi:SAP domain-containing new25
MNLKRLSKLSPSMSLQQFDNGYWYTTELQEFAQTIGVPSASKLRKDELEKAVKLFLQTGKITNPAKRSLTTSGTKDVERGLDLKLPVQVYTNNKETKDFLEREARKIAPNLKRKSGVRYRLNRWREDQIVKGRKITYGDLVKEYVRLNQLTEPFAKIPHGRYINFLSEYLAKEKNASREQGIKAWKKLKTLDIPKDYRSWARWVKG